MARDLPTFYYRDNFVVLVDAVEKQYRAVFSRELRWITTFRALSFGAQCLLVRLIMRTQPSVRRDSLNYPEISSIDSALDELESHQFIGSERVDLETTLRLASKQELLVFLKRMGVRGIGTKREAVDHLRDTQYPELTTLSRDVGIVEHRMSDNISTLLLLFFGNTRQTLVEFILRDLGIRRPPSWPLAKIDSMFTSVQQVNAHLDLAKTSDAWFQNRRDIELETLRNYLVDDRCYDPLYRRRSVRHNDSVAREMERRGLLNDALEWYLRSPTDFAWERSTRILVQQNRIDDAIKRFHQPPSDSDAVDNFTRRFSRKLSRLTDRVEVTQDVFSVAERRMSLTRSDVRVEQAVMDALASDGYTVYFSENRLINSFSIACYWSVVSAPVSGAFLNAFQSSPIDFFSYDFTTNRSSEFEVASKLFGEPDWRIQVLDRWRELSEFSIALWFPHVMPLSDVESWLMSFSGKTAQAIVEYLFSDLKNRRAGQPDLIARNPGGEWRFIEVKGPGDSLSDQQRRWLTKLNSLGIKAEVLWVTYDDD